MACRLAEIFLAAALLFVLCICSTLQAEAQGGSVAVDDAAEYVPAWTPSSSEAAAARDRAAAVVGIPVRHCGQCRCCANSNREECLNMTCCKESVCTPMDGCTPVKPIYCGCDPKACVVSPTHIS